MRPHLRRLVLHRFRNIVPDTELRFDPGVNVVLGKNASGKTTLLRVLEAVLSGRMQLLWDEQASVSAEFEVDGERTTVRYSSDPGSRTETLAVDAHRAGSRASLSFEGDFARLVVDGTEVSRSRHYKLEGNVRGAVSELAVRDWTALRPFDDQLVRFPEDLSHFDRVMRGEVRVSARPPGSFVTVVQSPTEWGSLLYREGHLIHPWHSLSDSAPRELVLVGTPIHDAAREMGFESAEVKLRAVDTGASPVVYGDLDVALQRRDGSWVRAEQLSWGQKRLLSWWLVPAGRYWVSDELTNGLHHEWIERVLARMGGHQAFLATQNPLLLDHLEFGAADEVQRRIVACRTAQNGRERLAWTNPTREQAERFFTAYQVGIQHVSELLRLEDLW
ncbi:MAG: AAA family ATPase [Myxococcota bacterium]